jgi:hypothetical protein
MKHFIRSWVSLFALLVLPFAGCSGSTTEGAAGAGGDAGAGGNAGAGGMAGTGGSEPSPRGLWTGSGQGGADGAFTICFNLSEDGSQLESPLDATPECGNYSFAIEFEDCEGALLDTETIPIVDGVFVLFRDGTDPLAGYWDITGTFDGNTASGEAIVGAVVGTCSASWEATPSQ